MLDYLTKAEYVEKLFDCEVGIFNNNRQQGLGNIWILLDLGKKVYLRTDTSMWKYFQQKGAVIYDISEIKKISSEELFSYTDKKREVNYRIADERNISDRLAWKSVFCSIENDNEI